MSPIKKSGQAPNEKMGEFFVTPSYAQVFMFSAATWNRHQIHFNRKQAEAEGFPDVVVQRGLLGNFLAQFVQAWAGKQGTLERLQWKVVQSTFPDQRLKCQGEVSRVDQWDQQKKVTCSIRILNDQGGLIAAGEAQVRFKNEDGPAP